MILPAGSAFVAGLPLDAAGAASLPLSVPPAPGLVGLMAVFQALQTGAQPSVKNPVIVTVSG